MKKPLLILITGITLMLTSCYTSHFTVGDGPVNNKGKQETYDQAKQVWLFWGLINVSDGQPATPSDGNYMIKTKKKLSDCLITGLTGGILCTRTVKIRVYEEPPKKEVE